MLSNINNQTGKGTRRLRTWGERVRELIQSLLAELQSLPDGFKHIAKDDFAALRQML
jgi:hypothetical protein